ncbi:hypothetical protein ABPG72_011471 [Tetrahymena utriculariae]
MSQNIEIVNELKRKEKCLIKYQDQQYLFLNEQQISQNKNDLIKILIFSQKNLTRVIDQQIELISTALQFLQYNQNKVEVINQDEQELDEYHQIESSNSQYSEESDSFSSESENYLQNFDQQIERDINFHDKSDKKDQKLFYTEIEKIKESYDQLVLDLLDEKAFQSEITSPYFIKQIQNKVFLNGSATNLEAFSRSFCNKCASLANNTLNLINNELIKQNIFLVFDHFNLNLQQQVKCSCKTKVQRQTISCEKINTFFSNISSQKLEIFGSLSHNPNKKIEIELQNYLQSLIIQYEIYSMINFKNQNEKFIQQINLYIDRQSPMEQLLISLQKFKFEHINLISITTPINISLRSIINSNMLIYLKKKNKSYHKLQKFNLVNYKFTATLSLFCFHKLFKNDFSFYRVMYDLHEYD